MRVHSEHKPRAVKAIWADVPMSDAYRDVTFHGGAIDAGLHPAVARPDDRPVGPPAVDPRRATRRPAPRPTPTTCATATTSPRSASLEATLGGDGAYDGPFYRLRSPGDRADQLEIPVVITGGWWDIFQRGEPLLYEQLKHSPNKKLFMSPHYHTGGGPAMEDPELKQKWFDRWLKGVKNGVEKTPAVNLYPMGGTAWQHYKTWPVPGTKYTPLFLDGAKSGSANSLNDGSLAATAAAQGDGDEAPLLPASSPCSRMTTQWTAGAAAGPCETDNRTFEASGLTYTTAPLENDLQLTGPIVANVWAELTSKDATLVAVLSDVGADGASNQVTAGFLLASQRAIDPSRSTYGPGRVMIRPFHPFTRESQQDVTPNDPQLYRIEIYPTAAQFKKGDRIRLTLGTADTPATATPLPALLNELGGDIRVLRGGQYDSHVLLPMPGG